MMATSLGPAGKSISARSRRSILAAVTYTFPARAIFCTGAMLSVPRAMAAMAWAPPTWSISSTPAMSIATRVKGFTGAGVQAMTALTPATFAGIAHINAVLGYDAVLRARRRQCGPAELS